MSITAQDIENEGFEHSLRGYDVEQVDDFLERVAKEVDEMNKTISDLKEQLAAAQAELSERSQELDAARVEPEPDPLELESANRRADQATEELEKVQAKAADALVRAEEAEVRATAAEKRAAEAEALVEPLKAKLEEKNKMDSAIAQAFIAAQRSADQIKEEARAEGDRIYRESEAKAREFIREALAKKASINGEIEALELSAQRFRAEYRELLGRFTKQAESEFASVATPEITDDEVDAELPEIESMPGLTESTPVVTAPTLDFDEKEDADLPRISFDDIPEVSYADSSFSNAEAFDGDDDIELD